MRKGTFFIREGFRIQWKMRKSFKNNGAGSNSGKTKKTELKNTELSF